MRKSDLFLLFTSTGLLLVCFMFVHSNYSVGAARELLEQKTVMVEKLQLTDLCLCTGATYARHPSQADRHSPFQDHPAALEHYPAGSIIAPGPVMMPRRGSGAARSAAGVAGGSDGAGSVEGGAHARVD